MRHLFIINPFAHGVLGRLPEIRAEIESGFAQYPWLVYDIHVTRWQRDAVGFIKQYCYAAPDLVRVYAVGGIGTLYEVINGVIGLPNVQVAFYPQERIEDNPIINALTHSGRHLFASVGDLVFAQTHQFDLIRCNDSYGLAFSLLGLEALIYDQGEELINRYGIFPAACYGYAAMSFLRFNAEQHYRVLLDNSMPLDGYYLSAMIANQPHYRKHLKPGTDARINDGLLDLYLWRPLPKVAMLRAMRDYVRGQYQKWPEYIMHHRFRSLTVQSEDLIAISLDGEFSYCQEVTYEVLPGVLDFVCPEGVEPIGAAEPDEDSAEEAMISRESAQAIETAAAMAMTPSQNVAANENLDTVSGEREP